MSAVAGQIMSKGQLGGIPSEFFADSSAHAVTMKPGRSCKSLLVAGKITQMKDAAMGTSLPHVAPKATTPNNRHLTLGMGFGPTAPKF